jgi:hypothetical protein
MKKVLKPLHSVGASMLIPEKISGPGTLLKLSGAIGEDLTALHPTSGRSSCPATCAGAPRRSVQRRASQWSCGVGDCEIKPSCIFTCRRIIAGSFPHWARMGSSTTRRIATAWSCRHYSRTHPPSQSPSPRAVSDRVARFDCHRCLSHRPRTATPHGSPLGAKIEERHGQDGYKLHVQCDEAGACVPLTSPPRPWTSANCSMH